jgi:hypothetical protein
MIVRSSGIHSLLRQQAVSVKEIAVPVPTYKLSVDSPLFFKRLRLYRYARILCVAEPVVQISAQRLAHAVINPR